MRAARINDYRRRLREAGGNWPVRLERFAFEGVASVGAGEFAFASAMTFLSGPNGVGKTTLLRGIWAALAPKDAQSRSGSVRRLQGGSVKIGLVEHGRSHECTTRMAAGQFVGDASHGLEVVHIDAADEIQRHQAIFESHPEIDNYTEGVGSHSLTDVELSEIKFLARREYRSVNLYEVDGLGEHFPFFEVALREDRYDSRTMGAGELAVFFLWWSLRRASRRSILLIEEPETFLSPASQDALGAYLVAVGCEKQLCVVVTTHSAPMIIPMGTDSLRFVIRDHNGVGAPSDVPAIVLRNLGIDPPVQAVLLAEDELAVELGRALLERFEPRLARKVDFCSRGGSGEVASTLRVMPNTARLKFIGALDGDVRGQVPQDVAGRCIYLPGDKATELGFRDMVVANPQALSDVLGSDRVPAILGGLEGRDHHDWYRELATELGYTKAQLFPFMLALWLRDDANVAAAKMYVEALQTALEHHD